MKTIFTTAAFLITVSMICGQTIDPKLLEGFSFRNVGPAGMSGRITAIDVVLSEPDHIYIGSASGGVWESKDGGIEWKPLFQDQPTMAIGAIKINQQNPSEIWVGTGEGNPRNSLNCGKGIFRSLDGGRTWTLMGLSETKVIHRILIDPHDPSTVYAGAGGSPWGPNTERGLFKTTDSGKTWKKILYTNDKTGIADLIMDPTNPRKLIAAMYEHLRTPWDFTSGGEGSGLHLSYDGGETWKKLTTEEGLPKGNLGRIGLALAASKPDIIYALIEAKENGLYKSVDGGENWSLVSTKNIGNRPFYYHELYVDPQNENRIWNLYSYVSKSEDGGRTFQTILDYGKGVHPDHHAFWIHPHDADYMIDGNDGGLNISRDGGRNWYFCTNIPVGQFYHVDYDLDYPYNLYGGMQDNGSWVGPAYVLKAGGIRNNDWRELYFGDGFDVLPKRSDSRYGWAMSQGGNLTYYDRETGFNSFSKPVHPYGIKLRYNWNAALAAIPSTTCGIYYGSQFVHKSLDCGKTWSIISPDLTTNDTTKQKQDVSGGLTTDATGAENHTTILCIAPGKLDPNVIWAGTDDGNVQVTQDGGTTWTNVSDRIKGFPKGAWVPQIEVSPHQKGEAFVVVNDYRRNNWKAYTFHTTDFGRTWQSLANDDQINSFVQCIVQDPVVSDLLFLGADDGLYVSIDHGKSWSRFPSKVFPRVSTMDLKIHEKENSLIIGTFGRALWVLDNLKPLRALASMKGKPVNPMQMFESLDGVQANYRSVDGIRFTADAEYKGDNKQGGVQIPVYIMPVEKKSETQAKDKTDKEKNKDAVTIDSTGQSAKKDAAKAKMEKDKDLFKWYVIDGTGDTLRRASDKLKEGWNTIGWDMRRKGVRFPSRNEPRKDADDPGGEYVLPGQYTIVGVFNGHKDSIRVNVLLDPRLNITAADLADRNRAVRRFYDEVELAEKSFALLQNVRKDMRMIESLMSNAPDSIQEKLTEKNKVLSKQLAETEALFMAPEDVKGYTSEINLSTYLGASNSYLNSSLGQPGSNALEMLSQTQKEVDKAVSAVNTFLETHWMPYQMFVKEMQWPVFKPVELIQRK